MMPNRMNAVAVIGLKRIGDAIYTLPLFEAIKTAYPTARIVVFSEPQVQDIYIANPYVTELQVFSKKVFWQSTLSALKSDHFDACILLHNAFKYALLPFLAGIPIRIGYQKELRGFLLSHSLPLPKTVVHRIEHNARLGDFLAVNSRGILPKLYFTEPEIAASNLMLMQHQLASQGYIAFIVGSISPTRRWFPQNFAQLADAIVTKLGLKVVILGGPDDVEIAQKVMALVQASHAILNLAGQTSLRESLLFFKQARAVVSNDTGPMHAASAIGVPVVTWFGAANELEIKPPSPLTTVLNAHVHCSPCVKEVCAYQLECLHLITPAMVLQSLKELL